MRTIVFYLCSHDKGDATNQETAGAFAANVLPVILQMQATGTTTHRAVAAALNARGTRTARGGVWHDSRARNLLAREVPG